MFRRTLLAAGLAIATVTAPANAQQLTRLNISMQPALYSMVPLHLGVDVLGLKLCRLSPV